ncbi:GtrA family protein [Patescibacteria group bacterium]
MKLFIKYSIVGASGTIVDLTILYLLVEYAHINVFIAATISFIIAVFNNFTLNKFWTFQDNSQKYTRQFLKFFMVSLVGLLLTLSFMYFFISVVGIWYMLAKIFTTFIVLIWNFTVNKYWTFKLPVQREIW